MNRKNSSGRLLFTNIALCLFICLLGIGKNTILVNAYEYSYDAITYPYVTLPVSHIIAIDPGHQAKGDSHKEPIGPGSQVTKAKVATGTCGVATKIPESELCLALGLKLQAELEKRGYTVVMTRTTNDVNISNSERAEIANAANAEAFIRIHANGSSNPSVHGAMTLCQTSKNPYNGSLADASYSLSSHVLDCMVEETKCKKLSIQQTDTMSGINWCNVPVTIIEVGFMSNASEDKLMSTDDYQESIVTGIANGIDEFINDKHTGN